MRSPGTARGGRLSEQLGIEPGAALRELEQAILRHDPALAPPGPVKYGDPGEYVGEVPARDLSHSGDAALNRRIRAASRLSGPARARAYAKLDLTLTRDIVPSINYGNAINQSFFSARIGCQVYQPLFGIDLDALCLRHRH